MTYNIKIVATVRRSSRFLNQPLGVKTYGLYHQDITVRERILNPKTGRMVFIDGVVGRKLMREQAKKEQKIKTQQEKELCYFEMMKQRLMENELDGETSDDTDTDGGDTGDTGDTGDAGYLQQELREKDRIIREYKIELNILDDTILMKTILMKTIKLDR